MTSPDGINWTLRNNIVNNGWRGLAYGNGLWVAAASGGGTGNRVMTSPDGINWTIGVTPTVYNNVTVDREWRSLTYGNGVFVAVASSGSCATCGDRVMTSADGINWTLRTTGTPGAIRWVGVTYGDGRFVAVAHSTGTVTTGKGRRVIYSQDGITWTNVVTPEDNSTNGIQWRGVAYGKGRFVAVAVESAAPTIPVMVSMNTDPAVGGTPPTVAIGTNVVQEFKNDEGEVTAAVNFGTVTTPGTLSIAPITTYTAENPAPAGFALGDPPVYYDIDFAGTFSGPVEVCFSYPVGAFGTSTPALFHLEGGEWKNITTSVNTTTRIVCGTATSFFPFALGVDSVDPVVTDVVATPNPVAVGNIVTLTATATDNVAVTHAYYTIDDGAPVSFLFTPGQQVTLSASISGLAVGVYELRVTAVDAAENFSDGFAQLAVYDPNAGFVTGGGWFNSPAGSFQADPLLTGRANFGFVSRYQKGANVPTGNTSFQFQAGSLSFSSTSYEWLVVNRNDTSAQYKGVGTVTINGLQTPGAGFMLWAQDGKPDLFRMMITAPNGAPIYDNKIGSEFGTAISGGNIIVHTKN
jgi:hypothetical protein